MILPRKVISPVSHNLLAAALLCSLAVHVAPAFAAEETASPALGRDVAARHDILLDQDSLPVLGNGEIGLLIRDASTSHSFLDGKVVGEHWLLTPAVAGRNPVPATRIAMAEIDLRWLGREEARVLRRARLSLSEGVLRFEGDGVSSMSGRAVVSASENLIDLHFESNETIRIAGTISLPDLGFNKPRLSVSGSRTVNLVNELPGGESYGIGVILRATTVRLATEEYGWQFELDGEGEAGIRLLFVEPEEGMRLEETLEVRCATAELKSPSIAHQERIAWWDEFWNRSVLDVSGSDSPGAAELERLWVRSQFAMKTHAAGTYPPGDSGYWLSPVGGRAWHSDVWNLYRGWLRTGHARDIGILSYPLQMEGGGSMDPSSPLLPFESGPDGVDAGPSDDLVAIRQEVAGMEDDLAATLDVERFCAIPFLVSAFAKETANAEGVDTLYPFLRNNADRILVYLEQNGGVLTDQNRDHLCEAVRVASRVAERVRIDLPSRERWAEGLRAYGGVPSSTASFDSKSDPPENIETLLARVKTTRFTPEGLALRENGTPSILLTATLLEDTIAALAHWDGEAISLFPGIPKDGAWSIRLNRVSVAGRFVLRSLILKRGVVDSFLLHSTEGGACGIYLPEGWSSAQIARLGETPQPIEVERESREKGETVRFETDPGADYLVGPVW